MPKLNPGHSERPVDAAIRVWGHLDGAFAPMGVLSYVFAGKDSFCLFHYVDEWIYRPGAFPADPASLPLKEGVFRTQPDEEIFSGIRDACPDGWGSAVLELAAKQAGFSLRETDYMLFPGHDRIGALAFGPMEAPMPFAGIPAFASASASVPSLEELAEAVRLSLDGHPLPQRLRHCLPALTVAGGDRPKAAVHWKGEPCLAKFDAGEFPWNAVRAEHACMTLAAECGIRTARTRVERLPDGTEVLLVKRFDRERRVAATPWKDVKPAQSPLLSGLLGMPGLQPAERESRGWPAFRQWPFRQTAGKAQTMSGHICEVRIPFASEMTLCGIPEHKADGSWQDMARKAHPKDREELFRRMCFDALCDNCDGHLRNTGFLLQNGVWRLAPVYDIAPCPVSGGPRAAQSMGLQGDAMTRENLLSDTLPFGLSQEEAAAVFDKMAAHVCARWDDAFRDAGVPRRAELTACQDGV